MGNILTVLRFGWPYLQRYWRRFLLGVLLGVLFGVSNASFVWAAKTMFERLSPPSTTVVASAPSVVPQSDQVHKLNIELQRFLDRWLPRVGRDADWRSILGGLLLLPVLAGFRGFIGYFSSYCMGWVSERVITDLRANVLTKLNSLSLDFFNRSKMGDLLTRINGDTFALHQALNTGFSDLVKEPITIVSLFIALCWADWKLTMIGLFFMVLCLIPMVILGKKARKAGQGSVNAQISQSSLLVEALLGIRIIKAFGLENEQVERFRKLSRQLIYHGMKGVQSQELVNPIIELIAAIGVGFILICIFYTHRSMPDVVGFLTGMGLFFPPVRKLGRIHIMFQKANYAVSRLIHIFEEQPTVKESTNPKRATEFKSELAFENVSFSYGDRLVLQDVNLKIHRGFKLGIAGESGSGKSTLVNLLFRFYDPTSGAIRFDGVDLRELAITDLHLLMAMVSQEVVLFDLTVAENIACGKRGATRQEVEDAAHHADAHDFIMHLPQGYETGIGERGVTLSGGQRQRLAIARAFIRNAPILVLDEATASLDSESESEVQTAIDRLAENRTVISVAHRLSTLASSDRIIVLEQGRIIEEGSFTELLRSSGGFAAMARKQGIVDQGR